MNEPITVTHVVSGDVWAGAEVQVYQLFRGLLATGQVLPTAVVFNEGALYQRLVALGIPVTLADEARQGTPALVKTIAKHLRENGAAVVHTHGFKENITGTIAQWLARVPCSLRTAHGNPETVVSFRQVAKWAVRKFDELLGRFGQNAVVAVSTQLEQVLKPLFPGKVHKIFNFVDVESLHRESAGCKKKVGEPLTLGLIGRLVPVKRVDIFIDVVEQLNQRGFDVRGLIIGDGPLRGSLTARANDKGLRDKITFAGFVDPVLPAMGQLDVLLMPSDHEGLPMTLLEALALELPVVAHNVGGIPEVLDSGHSGWLVDDHSPAGYSQSVEALLSDEAARRAKTDAGLNHVKARFDVKTNAREYLDLYQSLVFSRANFERTASR